MKCNSTRHSRKFAHVFILLALVASAALFPRSSFADAASDFVGRWVVTAGNQNLIVFEISADSNANGLRGTLSRPTSIRFKRPLLVEAVTGTTVQLTMENLRLDDRRLRFTTAKPTDPKQQDSFEISMTESGKATLNIIGLPMSAMPLLRTTKDEIVSKNWSKEAIYSIDDHRESSAEMLRIFNEDQAARMSANIDWSVVGKADAARREATRKLLDDGELNTGHDFERAAFVFQHGSAPGDYLLAHTLAMIAVAKGNPGGLWISTATLDRYLQSIGQPQIYGTQFNFEPGKTAVTQGNYQSNLITDSLRQHLGVPSVAQQEEQRKAFEAQRAHQKN